VRDDVGVPVRVCLLGPVAVLGDDGHQVDVGGPRARALLAGWPSSPAGWSASTR
jgi:hypothetical protein